MRKGKNQNISDELKVQSVVLQRYRISNTYVKNIDNQNLHRLLSLTLKIKIIKTGVLNLQGCKTIFSFKLKFF